MAASTSNSPSCFVATGAGVLTTLGSARGVPVLNKPGKTAPPTTVPIVAIAN